MTHRLRDIETMTQRVDVEDAVPHRRLYRIPEAMKLLSMSRSSIYEQIRSGRLRSVTQGRARYIPATALTEYINLLVAESQDGYGQPA